MYIKIEVNERIGPNDTPKLSKNSKELVSDVSQKSHHHEHKKEKM